MSRSATAGSGICATKPAAIRCPPTGSSPKQPPCAAAARPVQFRCAPRCRIRAGRTRRTGRTGRGGGRRATLTGSRSPRFDDAARRPGAGHGVSPRRKPRAPLERHSIAGRRKEGGAAIIERSFFFLAAAMSASSSVSDFVTVRGVQLHVRRWGRPDAPTLFAAWLDGRLGIVPVRCRCACGRLAGDRARCARFRVVRLAGRAAGRRSLLVPRVPGRPRCARRPLCAGRRSPRVGHSMGANVVPVCRRAAGARAARGSISRVSGRRPRGRAGAAPVARLAGRVARTARAAPLCIPRRRGGAPDQTNPRLDPRRAAFLAAHWSKRGDDGQYHLLADPAHKMPARSCTGSTK